MICKKLKTRFDEVNMCVWVKPLRAAEFKQETWTVAFSRRPNEATNYQSLLAKCSCRTTTTHIHVWHVTTSTRQILEPAGFRNPNDVIHVPACEEVLFMFSGFLPQSKTDVWGETLNCSYRCGLFTQSEIVLRPMRGSRFPQLKATDGWIYYTHI